LFGDASCARRVTSREIIDLAEAPSQTFRPGSGLRGEAAGRSGGFRVNPSPTWLIIWYMSKRTILASAIFLLAASAVPALAQGYIKCVGNVGRAGVFVDGNYLGPAYRFTLPEKYAVSPGEHEVVLRDPRYEEFRTKVTVEEGKVTKVKFKMTRRETPKGPFGRLRFGGGVQESFLNVAGGDTSAVYINNQFWGYVDEFNNPGSGILLPPGTYEVRVDSPIYGQINEKVTIEANKVTVIPLSW